MTDEGDVAEGCQGVARSRGQSTRTRQDNAEASTDRTKARAEGIEGAMCVCEVHKC